MTLDLTDEDRDLLLMALGQMTSTPVSGNREHALELLKRLSRLEPEDSGLRAFCNGCNTLQPVDGPLVHKPGCPWVARYGR